MVYLGETNYDIGHVVDHLSVAKVVYSLQSKMWWDVMRDEMQSMRQWCMGTC